MLMILSAVVLLLIAVTMGLALAHALEFPGKLRLDERTYRAVQAIYYPGFTIGGLIGELGALVAVPVLLIVTPAGTERFWWTAASLGFLLLGHLTYWVVTHPVNSAWLKDTKVSGPGSLFFTFRSGAERDWKQMRNVWEYSHVARAFLYSAGFLSMVMAVTQ
jgi:hypothetical protein